MLLFSTAVAILGNEKLVDHARVSTSEFRASSRPRARSQRERLPSSASAPLAMSASFDPRFGASAGERIDCWHDSVEISKSWPIKPSKKIYYNDNFTVDKSRRRYKTKYSVDNVDCVDAGIEFKSNGLNPVILNLADRKLAGGFVSTGSGCQEESIFRRSNYHMTLLRSFYPIENHQGVYSPSVAVFKESEANRWKRMNENVDLSFIAVPGLRKPVLKDGKLSDHDHGVYVQKIRLILQIAYKYNHDAIILGALGCGVFRGPVKEIAMIFRQVLDEFESCFHSVKFAILSHAEGVEDNLEIFRQVVLKDKR